MIGKEFEIQEKGLSMASSFEASFLVGGFDENVSDVGCKRKHYVANIAVDMLVDMFVESC